MTSLPIWLVERAALDEVPPASRARVAAADPDDLAREIAALRVASAAELAAHPAAPAVAQLTARAGAARARAHRRRIAWFGSLAVAAAALALVVRPSADAPRSDDPEVTRAKGPARLVVYRQVGDRAERLGPDARARAGDVLQLRYDASGQRYGLIASLDGAGVVTLHFPASEDATTEVAAKPTTLPQAYALDAAPRFERFFFFTADEPIDVGASLAALRALAGRADSAEAAPELPIAIHQWSLRVVKP